MFGRKGNGLQSWCKDCRKDYYQNNKDLILKKNKIRYEKNKDAINLVQRQKYNNDPEYKKRRLEHNKKYRETHKEEKAIKDKEYRENNKEKLQEYFRNYEIKNKSKRRNYLKKYKKENPEIISNNNARRKALKQNAIGNGIIRKEWIELMKTTNYRCFYCDVKMEARNRTLDHIIALSRGGPHIKENLLPCCLFCNCSKKDKMFDEWKGIINLPKDKYNYLRYLFYELKREFQI